MSGLYILLMNTQRTDVRGLASQHNLSHSHWHITSQSVTNSGLMWEI